MDWKTQLANLSPEVVKLPITLFSGWLMNRLLTKGADLISYMSHVQTVNVAAPAGVIHTFSLFLWNQGKAAAKNIEIGHHFRPLHSVYPDVVRNEVQTPGGGMAIQIPSISPKTQVTITYLLINLPPNTPVVSHVTYENGPTHHVQVQFQRVYSKRVQLLIGLLILAGIYVVIGWLWQIALLIWHRA